MLRQPMKISVAVLFALMGVVTPSAASHFLDTLDREHEMLVPQSGHAHATGQVLAVDIESGTVRIASVAIESPDKTISRPAAEALFHVTNRANLRGLRQGDMVAFEVARVRGAVMITKIRKAS